MTVQIDWNVAADADLAAPPPPEIEQLLPGSTTATPTGSTTSVWALWATVTPPTASRRRSSWRPSICRHCVIPPSCVPGCTPSPGTRRCGHCAPVNAKRHPMSYAKSVRRCRSRRASRAQRTGRAGRPSRGRTLRPRPRSLNLAYRHGLTGSELAQALGVSNDSAKKMVQRLRDTVEKSLGALLVVRQAKSGHNNCPEMAAIVAGWDGRFTILLRKRISRHIESCPNCDEERGRLVNPRALLGASAVLIPAPKWLRDQTLTEVRLAPAATSGTAGTATHAAGHVAARLSMVTGRFALLAVAVVAVPAVAWGLMAGGPAPNDVPLAPSRVDAPTSMTAPSQQPTVPARESSTPPPQPNVSTPQQSSSMPPPPGPANTDGPTVADQGTQPAPSPALVPTEAPRAPAVAPTRHAAPASLPSKAPIAPRPQRPSQPPVKHCPDGSAVTGDQSYPTPQPSPPPQCPHVAVPGNPICGRTGSGS